MERPIRKIFLIVKGVPPNNKTLSWWLRLKVICTTGDGVFQMYMKELPTGVQYEAPVTWIVLNNFSLGWIKLHEWAMGERYIAVDFEAQP